VQGQSDTLFNLNDAASTYRALARRGVPVGMIWNSGGHGGYSSKPGECEAYDGTMRSVRKLDRCYLSLRSLGWMDHWLRHTRAGRGPAFTYYRSWVRYDGRGPDDEQYGAAATFPIRHRATTFTLSSTDRLVRVNPVAGSATFLNPSGGQPAAYSETSNFSGPDSSPQQVKQPPAEQQGQFAAFTSRPFGRAVHAVGVPSARLRITNSNGQDMVFFAKVYDVAPGGGVTLIHRLVAPVRVPASAVGDPVRIKLLGFAHRFGKGHRVRLVLCSTDATSYNAKTADVLTVTTGPGSTFTLPARVG
jgi:ABC-2 type transport system ATP-binding protein